MLTKLKYVVWCAAKCPSGTNYTPEYQIKQLRICEMAKETKWRAAGRHPELPIPENQVGTRPLLTGPDKKALTLAFFKKNKNCTTSRSRPCMDHPIVLVPGFLDVNFFGENVYYWLLLL